MRVQLLGCCNESTALCCCFIITFFMSKSLSRARWHKQKRQSVSHLRDKHYRQHYCTFKLRPEGLLSLEEFLVSFFSSFQFPVRHSCNKAWLQQLHKTSLHISDRVHLTVVSKYSSKMNKNKVCMSPNC